jgi:integrase/recombinase XerD
MVPWWHTLRDLPCPVLNGGHVRAAEPEVKYFSQHEVTAMVDASRYDPTVHALVLLGVDAGLRVGEMAALRWSDLKDGLLIVSRSRTPHGEEGPTKSGKVRSVPLTPRLLAALHPLDDHAECVLLFNGRPTKHKQACVLLRRVQDLAGVERSGVHALRHTFCSSLAKAGVPVHVIAALAGHASITTTQLYLHLHRGDLVGAIETLGHTLGTPSTPSRAVSRSHVCTPHQRARGKFFADWPLAGGPAYWRACTRGSC